MTADELNNKYIVTDILNEKHGTLLVRDRETGRQYVEKILTVYSTEVYENLAAHPISNIPAIHEFSETDGLLYVIEEYIYGQNLKDLLNISGKLPEKTAVDIIRKLCHILIGLHSFDPPIVHRDIKPSNIIIAPDDSVWLIDLNAAKLENSNESKDTVLIGTEGYAAPEQYGFGPSNYKTDIFAVGILLNEMLTGKLPSECRADGPIWNIINKCTRMYPSERYDSAKDIITALNKLPAVTYQSPVKKPETLSRSKKYHKWLPPGFRSLKLWKMILSAAGYIFLFAIGLTLKVNNAGTAKLWVNRIGFIFVTLLTCFFLANYGDIWTRLSISRIKWLWLKIIAIIAAACLLFCILMIIFSIINTSL